ncbi:pentatricopeptide repeat-containing protein at1g62910 [Phtheirospermum japonicum]|uniref:Pentatricopeptide repeat-containing protein at1g62910 n=1 Tax=Phtheirospermum japonicum TaxID=374723 RepID=A0A830CKZ8_9LAMI|nr:pentatricopeptide repeat-containing protein at1g62910 [Phtheirospermum japonicum]
MKVSGFWVCRFLSSSPNCYGVGKSHFIYNDHTPPLPLSIFRCFCSKPASNCNIREKLNCVKGLNDALCLYDDMSRMRPLPGVIQFNQLLSRVVDLKEYSAATYLFKDIYELGISVSGITTNIAINSYCVLGRVDYGFSILGWFFKHGCVPDRAFNTLLKGLFGENKINEAQELFRKMVREGLCELDVVTYGTVINGLCKAGNTPMAIELLRVMKKGRRICKPNTHIYNMVIDGLCKDRMMYDALKLFDEMSEKVIPPDVATYNALVCGLCNLSCWGEAKMIIKKMIDYKIYPNVITFNNLIDALCKEGLVDEAKDVLQIMKQKNVSPDVISYSSLMERYCLQGRMVEARNVFDSSMASKNIAPNVWSYNILINGYCKKKK